MAPPVPKLLTALTAIFATIFIAGGINAVVNPALALSFFDLTYPTLPAHKTFADAMLAVYGARDVFIGLAMYAAAYFGTRQTLGWITVAAGGVAAADFAICRVVVGSGEWNHAYAVVVVAVGGLLAVA